MKNFFSFLAVAAALTLAACSSKTVGSDDAAKRLVAGEAPAFVVSVKIKDMLDKGGISSKENVPMVAQLLFSEKVEYFTNPEKMGVDLTGKSYMAVAANGKTHAGWMITKIKDKEAFEKMLKEEGNDKFEEVEGYNTLQEKNVLMAWNEKTLMIVAVSEGKALEKFKAYVTMMGEDKTPAASYNKFFEANTDLAFFNDISQSMAFQESMPEEMKADQRSMEMAKKIGEKLKGSYNLTTINFENDKVVADITNILSDAAQKELAFVGKTGFPKELMANLGSAELTGFFSFNTDVQKMLEWLISVTGNQDFLAEARQQSGLDVDKILAAFKGNLMMAFQGTTKVPYTVYDEEGKTSMDSLTTPRVTLIASTNNDYLATLADSMLKDQKQGEFFAMRDGINTQYLVFKPQVLVFTNDKNNLTNPGMPTLEAEAEKALNKPFGFYFNVNKMIAMMDQSDLVQGIAAKFKYAAGGMDINGGHAELILNNGGKNSLWTLINIGIESTADMMPSM